MWGRASESKRGDAIAPAAPATSAPSGVTPVAVVEPATARVRSRGAAAASTVPPAAPPVTLSRRARRAQTGPQPVVTEPAESAESTAGAETTTAPTVEPAAESQPAGEGSSTWLAESFATLVAAEAMTTASTDAALPDTAESHTAAPATPVESTLTEHAAAAEPVAQSLEPAAETTAPAERSSAVAGRAAAPAERSAAGAGERTEERPRTERVEPLTGPIPAVAPGVDEFVVAARLFAFTGETPVQERAPQAQRADEAETDATPEVEAPKHAATRRSRGGASFKRVAATSFSIGVFGIVGLMAVGMTTPAEAVAAVRGVDASLAVVAPAENGTPVVDESEIQAYVAPGDVQNDTLDRTENYTTTTTAQLASEAGIRNFSNLFHNNPNSNIQWPFAVGVTMSYGFGMRSGRMHEGIDFTPGAGAPVQAIADGVVRVASEAGGAYGVHVIIDHVIDGQLISSHYAHMQYGSLQVVPGQRVTVATVIGRTGNTGRSYGAHTHFELLQNGTTAIDPMPWLRTYTDGTHTVG